MTDQPKAKRGFAAMDPEVRREIARKGGMSVPAAARSFSKNRVLAKAAGRTGGLSVNAENRSFSRDRDLASDAGRKGGSASQIARRVITDATELGCFLLFLAAACVAWIGLPA